MKPTTLWATLAALALVAVVAMVVAMGSRPMAPAPFPDPELHEWLDVNGTLVHHPECRGCGGDH